LPRQKGRGLKTQEWVKKGRNRGGGERGKRREETVVKLE